MGEQWNIRLAAPRKGSSTNAGGPAVRILALSACTFALPLGASSAQTNELAVRYDEAASASSRASENSFSDEFADILVPSESNIADIDLALPSTAVDLGTFEPPKEVVPKTNVLRTLGTGVASYYGRRFHGRLTANGERFNMNAMTAAHKTLPFGTRVRVTNPRNGRSVIVRINDRGPFIRGRTIDLSRGAAAKIGMISSGHARVKLDIVSR